MKMKRGVYRQTWKGRMYDKETSSLRKQLDELDDFQTSNTAQTEDEAMLLSAAEEARARNRCPLVHRVTETAALSEKATKTQDLLERAWKMFQENAQDEAERKSEDWIRDDGMCDILTEVQELGRLRKEAVGSKTVGLRAEDDVDGSSIDSSIDSGDELLDSGDEASTLRLSRSGLSKDRPKPNSLTQVPPETVDELNGDLGKYFRSTLVRITNATNKKLHLKSKKLTAGKWLEGCSPPSLIEPLHEAVFASTSRSGWFGGTEAEVIYDTRCCHGLFAAPPHARGAVHFTHRCTAPPPHHPPPRVADWEFRMKWANPVVAGERGRYCEAEAVVDSDRNPGGMGRFEVQKNYNYTSQVRPAACTVWKFSVSLD
jgi:hypothetical protein